MKRSHLAVPLALIAVTLVLAAYRGATRAAAPEAAVASFLLPSAPLPGHPEPDSARAAVDAGRRDGADAE